MNFASMTYWLFLAAVVAVLWALPVRFRKRWLLFTSFVFYAAWSVPYLALLVVAATLNHFGAVWITAGERRERRGAWVIAGNLLLLCVFKYLTWMLGSLTSAFALLGLDVHLPVPRWALPLGISFYLFESISYIVDVVRKRETIHSFLDFQLFIAFFPKLIAGPILRAKEFLPQVERALHLGASDLRLAMRQIVLGLFLKTVLADSFGSMVDVAFARPVTELRSADAWVMGIGFGLQVYFDFSAYTRMALGSAKLCGIDLVDNFDNPFISSSPPEFWRRWHMSLSRWVRDYLFFPMAQHRGVVAGSPRRQDLVGRLALMRAAFLSMVIFGIWHGAGWTFVLYGVFHGGLLAIYHLIAFRERSGVDRRKAPRPEGAPRLAPGDRPPTDPDHAAFRRKLLAFCGWALTFGMVTIAWIIFRANTVSQALSLIERALRPLTYTGRTVPDIFVLRALGAMAVVLMVGHLHAKHEGKPAPPSAVSAYLDRHRSSLFFAGGEGLCLGILLVIALVCMTGDGPTFVYFQF